MMEYSKMLRIVGDKFDMSAEQLHSILLCVVENGWQPVHKETLESGYLIEKDYVVAKSFIVAALRDYIIGRVNTIISSGEKITASEYDSLNCDIGVVYRQGEDSHKLLMPLVEEKLDVYFLKSSIVKLDVGYVYLIKDVSLSGYYKIGYSRSVENRLKLFEVKLPFEFEVIHTIKTERMKHLERELHDKFSKKRINGEWFDLSSEDIEYIVSYREIINEAAFRSKETEDNQLRLPLEIQDGSQR